MILAFLYALGTGALVGLPADYAWRRVRPLAPFAGLASTAAIIAAIALAARIGLLNGAGAVVALIFGLIAGGAGADAIARWRWAKPPAGPASRSMPPTATSEKPMNVKPTTPRPPLWTKMPIARGNLIQIAGLAAGAALLARAASMAGHGPGRFIVALAGFLVIYDCSHAIGHWLAGRLAGIGFRYYGIRGTDHPEDYPPGFRQLMSVIPFWSVITDKDSMHAAAPWKKAMMFAAGEISTTVCSIAAAAAAMAASVPGGSILFWATVIWNAVSTVTVARTPKGDYAKALRVLRSAPAPAPAR